MSNNPRNTIETLQEKFKNICGFAIDDDDIILINDALGSYLRDEKGVKGKVYMFGSTQTLKALEGAGFDIIGFGQNPEPPVGDLNTGIPRFMQLKLEGNVGAVVISNDGYFDYNKLFKAANYLCDPECAFVATSDESRLVFEIPTGRKVVIPLVGSLLASLEAASDRKAEIIGKPSPYYLRYAKGIYPKLDPTRTVMVGDIMVTDIAFAANCGLDSILVCTGFDNEQTIEEAVKKNPDVALPTYITEGLADIGKFLLK